LHREGDEAGRREDGQDGYGARAERGEHREERARGDESEHRVDRRPAGTGEQRPEGVGPFTGGPHPCLPVVGLGQRPAYPQGDDDGKQADVEQPAPAVPGHHVLVDLGRQDAAQREAGDEEAGGAVAQPGRPALQDIGGTGAVLARHAHADQQAGREQAGVVPGEAAGEGADGVEQDAGHHGALAAEPVAERAEHRAAEPAGDEGSGDEAGGLDGRQSEVVGDLGQYEGDEDEVEAVEEVADPGGEEGLPLLPGDLAVPGLGGRGGARR
jgi:hypothetical protein